MNKYDLEGKTDHSSPDILPEKIDIKSSSEVKKGKESSIIILCLTLDYR